MSKKPHKLRKFLIGSIGIIFLIGLAGLLGVQIYVKEQTKDLPVVTYNALHSDSSSNIYAKDGTKIWSSSQNRRIYVKLKDVPQQYKNLLLSTEDSNFYKHDGFSTTGVLNAVGSEGLSKIGIGQARGGSTIGQQLIKLTVFSTNANERTVSRKVKELYLSNQLYKNYSHNQILEFYINKINMGENSYGAQTIAHTYFGKTLKQLSLSQQAIIAGLGQAPTLYNLYTNPQGVTNRRNTVLALAKEHRVINNEQYQKALKTPIKQGLKPRYWDTKSLYKISSAHNAYIDSTLRQVARMGYDITKTPMQIHTNLNIGVDNYLREQFNKHPEYFKNKQQQASATITDPNTGNVIAQIGGRYSNKIGDFNRATQLSRSTGSSIKPLFDYAPALEYLNWQTNHPLDGSAYTYPGTNIHVRNFDGSTVGNTNLTTALHQSYNPPAIRTLRAVGINRARHFIKGMNLDLGQPFYESNALGIDASTSQMASAYGSFSNGGIYHSTNYINNIVFSDDSKREVASQSKRVMRPSVAYAITKVLEGVVGKQGTLPQSDLTSKGIYAGAKSGTVGYPIGANVPDKGEIAMDVWTVGYTKSYSLALWQGYDQPNKPNHYIDENQIFSGKQKLYKNIMSYMARHTDTSQWKQPRTVRSIGSGNSQYYKLLDAPSVYNGQKDTGGIDKRLSEGLDLKVADNALYGSKKTESINQVQVPQAKTVPGYDKNWRQTLTQAQGGN